MQRLSTHLKNFQYDFDNLIEIIGNFHMHKLFVLKCISKNFDEVNFSPNIDVSGGEALFMNWLEKITGVSLSSYVPKKLVNKVCLVDNITCSVRKIYCLGRFPSILTTILTQSFKKYGVVSSQTQTQLHLIEKFITYSSQKEGHDMLHRDTWECQELVQRQE